MLMVYLFANLFQLKKCKLNATYFKIISHLKKIKDDNELSNTSRIFRLFQTVLDGS